MNNLLLQCLARRHLSQQGFCLVHGGGVRDHDVDGGTHGVWHLAVSGTVHAVADDVPAAAARKLIADDLSDGIVGNVRLHTSCRAVQYGGVVGQDRGTGGFVQYTLDHSHLIFSSLSVTGSEGVTFPAEGKRLFAVHGIPSFVKVIARDVTTVKGVVGINVDSAEGIDDVHETVEVYAEIVVDRNFVEHGQGIHADLYSVDPGVGQLVRNSVGDGQRHVIVTRSGDQEYLMGLGIDACQNVDVAAAAGRQSGFSRIASADVNIEDWVIVQVLYRRGRQFIVLDCGFDAFCAQRANL